MSSFTSTKFPTIINLLCGKKKFNFLPIVAFMLTNFLGAFNVGHAQTSTISSPNQVAAGNVVVGGINQVISQFQIVQATSAVNLTALADTASGTYVTADIVAGSVRLWYSTSSSFSVATATPIKAISSTHTSGAKETFAFTSLTQSLSTTSTNYFYITVDFTTAATTSNTITSLALANTAFTIASGSKSGSVGIAGTKTIAAQSAFVPGNLAVLQAAASANNTTGNVLEINPSNGTGAVINIAATGTNALRFSGSATSTLYAGSTLDKSLFTFTGGNTSTTSGNINAVATRAVGTLNNAKTFALQTTYSASTSGGTQTRSATSIDNSKWFIGDQTGPQYVNSSGTLATASSANVRSIRAFGGNVYTLQNSSSVPIISLVTISGSPSAVTVTTLPNMAYDANAVDFYMVSSTNTLNFDIAYVTTSTGIKKYVFDGTNWNISGSPYTTPGALFGVCAFNNGSSIDIYVTAGTGASTNNNVLKLNDAPSSGGLTGTANFTTVGTVYTAIGSTILKGLDFAPVVAPTISASALADATYCPGASSPTTLDVTATAGSGSTVTYLWYSNTANSTTGGTLVATHSAISNGTKDSYTPDVTNATASDKVTYYYCVVMNPYGSYTTSSVAKITINPALAASVTLDKTSNSVCSLTSTATKYTATPTNGGTPTYVWTLSSDGTNYSTVGTNSNTYTTASNLSAGTYYIKLKMTSTAICATGSPYTTSASTLSVTSAVTPSVSIAGSSSVCTGTQTTYTVSSPTNAGASPTYQWSYSTDGSSYTDGGTTTTNDYTPSSSNSSNIVKLVMTSSDACASPATATTTLSITANAYTTASVSLAGSNSVRPGVQTIYTATPTNGGSAPTYNFKVNTVSKQNSTAATYSTNTLSNGDVVTVEITPGGTGCFSSLTPVASNSITVSVANVAFTPGNLIVYRTGDSTATNTSAASAIYLGEYTPAGQLVQLQRVSKTGVINNTITSSGTASSEGQLNLSTNGKLITFPGYYTTIGTSGVGSSTSASVSRVAATVDINNTVDTTTRLTDWTSGNNARSVITQDGTAFWVSGATGGVRYATAGSTTSTALAGSSTRSVNIFGNTLYFDDQSNFYSYGTTPPAISTSGNNLTTLKSGLNSVHSFCMFDMDATETGLDVLYIADDGGNIYKFCKVSGTWTAYGALATPSVRGLTGSLNGTAVSLFASTGWSSVSATSNNLYSFVDNSGYKGTLSGSINTIVSGVTTGMFAFRGISFAPTAIATQPTSKSVCFGTATSFTVAATSGANATYTYQWQLSTNNGSTFSNIVDGGVYSNATLTTLNISSTTGLNANQYRCIVTYMGNFILTSDAATLTVTSNTPSVTISTPSNSICVLDTKTTYTANPTLGGNSPSYQWHLSTDGGYNFTDVGSNSAVYSTDNNLVASSDYRIYVTVTSNATCLSTPSASSAYSSLIVTSAVTPSVSITGGTSGFVCAGNSITYTANPTNGGGAPTYDWYIDGTLDASNTTATYNTASALSNGNHSIYVILNSNDACASPTTATASTVNFSVNAYSTATISINTLPTLCTGISATLNTTISGGGSSPSYQWYKGNPTPTAVSGANANSYSSTFVNGDKIYVSITPSADACPLQASVSTSSATLSVGTTPTISITATGVVLYSGYTSTFAATTSGATSPTYQWYNDGVVINNNVGNGNTATAANYTATAADLTNNKAVTCKVTSSNGCTATSSPITVSVPSATAFTAGNIVVERVGDGITDNTNSAGRLFVDQFNPTGGAGQSPITTTPLPYSVGVYASSSSSSTNYSITTSANATSEGFMTLSTDGKYLAIPGYNAPITAASIASSSTSAPANNYRVAALVNANGVATVPFAADFQSGGNIRSVVSDGTAFWFAGNSGFYYFSNINDNSPKTYGTVNTRAINIFNGAIYGSSSVSPNAGINFVDNLSNLGDNGTSAAMTLLTTTNAPTNAYGSVLNPTGDVMYVADASAGIIKYTYNGTSWSKAYVLNTTPCLGLTGIFTGTNPILIATSNANKPSKLFSCTDVGDPGTASATSSSYTLISTSATTSVYKGVALAPATTQNSVIFVNTNYRNNTFSGAFASTYANTPSTTLTDVSKVNQFAIAGIFVNNDVIITPDAGFEVSLDAGFSTVGTHSSPLTIAASTLALSSTASTQQVYVRFNTSSAGTFNGNIVISSNGATSVNVPVSGIAADLPNYYYTGTGDLLSTTSWTSSATLTGGSEPSSVNNLVGVTWNIIVAGNQTLSSGWTLGSGSRIIIGNGTNSFNLTVPAGKAITGGSGVGVAANSILTWQDASNPIFTALSAGSTVNYNGSTTQQITAASYANLTLSNSGSKLFSGTYFIGGSLTSNASSVTTTGSSITFNGSSAQTIAGINFDALTISNNAGASINGNAIVASNLTISAGTLYVPAAQSLTVNGSSVSLSATGHLDVAGTFNNGTTAGNTCATFTQTTGSSVSFNYATGVYNHRGNGGNIPSATWHAASTCSITGISSTNPTSASFLQRFGNLTWNNASQANPLNINTSSFGTQGLLDIESTGSVYIALASGLSNTYTYSINSITVNNTAKLYTCIRTTSITPVVTLNMGGNINVAGTATLDIANGSSSAAATTYATTINLSGNLIATSTASFVAGNSNSFVHGKVIFNKSGTQTLSNAGTSGKIDYIISSGSKVVLGSNLTQVTTTPGDFITNNGLLDLGGYTLTCNNINSTSNVSTGLLLGNYGGLNLNGTIANTLNFRTTSYSDTLIGLLNYSGTGKVTLGSGLGITSLLSLNNASAVLDLNNNHLTIKSTSLDNTAEVGVVAHGATIIGGKVTVERYIPKELRNYRDLGASVANAGSVFANWQENGTAGNTVNNGFFITGTAAKGSPYLAGHIFETNSGLDYTTSGAPSMYTYNGTTWPAVTSTKALSLNPFQGYRAIVRGARNFNMGTNPNVMPTATTVRTTGKLVTGNITITTAGTTVADNSAYNSSFGLTTGPSAYSLIANPYACPVQWSKILGHSSIYNTYWYIDPTYQDPSTGLQRYITVQYSGGSIIVTPNPKYASGHNADPSFDYIQSGQGFMVNNYGNATPSITFREGDKTTGAANNDVFGQTATSLISIELYKNNGLADAAVANFNNNFTKAIGNEDASKMINSAENISITESNSDLSIDGLPTPYVNDVIPVRMGQLKANTTYQLKADISNFNTAGLQAYVRDNMLNTEVAAGSLISFTPTSVDIQSYKDRFSIVFKQSKVVVPVVTVKGSISVFPNPVTAKSFKVQTSNIASGKYNVVMVNTFGQEVMSTPITHVEGSNTETIKMSKALTSGVYTLVLKSAEGKTVYQTELLAK